MNIKANDTDNACPKMRKMSYKNKTSGGYTSIKKKKKIRLFSKYTQV